MNIFKRIYCRTFQLTFKLALPLLPYHEPKLLSGYQDIVTTLQGNNKKSILLVTDKVIRGLGLTKTLENTVLNAGLNLSIYDGTVANPTTANVAEALDIYYKNNCDCLIAFGGGSAIDCAKATGARVARPKKSLGQMKGILKVRRSIPLLIAIPTTAGTGSETTLAAVITDSETRHKYAINDFPLIPRYALLDAKITENLPRHITSTTGMDALTHAIEAYIGRSTTKSTRQNALTAIKLIFDNLEVAYNDGKNMTARQNMLEASYLAGLAFTKSYVGYVHAIAHSLGGKYNVPHGLANAVILPHVLKRYGSKIYKKLWRIGVYVGMFDKTTPIEIGAKSIIQKIEDMNSRMGIGTAIDAIQESDIKELAKIAEKEANPLYPVPVLYVAQQLEQIYLEVKNG
ncbi:MAG: iron-containing alcohol dehydrogenase [Clostridiales bacterium]|nr:iron-containing alcohol dehydrogenase [Clostridiales bacterium]